MITPSSLYSHQRLAARAMRASNLKGAERFLWSHAAQEMSDRLVDVSRDFSSILFLVPDASYADIFIQGRLVEYDIISATLCVDGVSEILPVTPQSYDLLISFGFLDHIDDIPGMLLQMCYALKPDGLMLASLFGPGTLGTLRALILAAEEDRPAARFHPQMRQDSLADLVSRAGFTMPVVDRDDLTIRYDSLHALRRDLREAGLANLLTSTPPYMGKAGFQRLHSAWEAAKNAEGTGSAPGKVTEYFGFTHITGWAPSPEQPQPQPKPQPQPL